MGNKLKRTAVILVVVLICAFACACGDITDQDPRSWPKKGPASSVPQPEAGTVTQALTKEDVDGKAFSIITICDFSAEDMGDYIRLLLNKGFSTYDAQKRAENYITYAARKNDKVVSLRLDTDTSELRVEIE